MFLQMCANLVGHTLVVSATQQVIHVRTGLKLSKPAKLTTPTSSTLRIKRRMSMYSTAWMAPRAGSDWVTETAKERSCGQIISLTTSHTGQRTNPTTSKMRIAFTPWVYDIALCGMMWAATAVITTPVLKVRLRELFPSWSNQLGFSGLNLWQRRRRTQLTNRMTIEVYWIKKPSIMTSLLQTKSKGRVSMQFYSGDHFNTSSCQNASHQWAKVLSRIAYGRSVLYRSETYCLPWRPRSCTIFSIVERGAVALF